MVPSASLLWFLTGAGLLIAEMMIPGFILIFFAVGSWITALAAWLMDVHLTTQIVIFIISSIVLLFSLRKLALKTFKGTTSDQADDQYADSKIGKRAIVTKEIHPHVAGEIKVMGSFWMAVADMEIEAGASVIITDKTSEDGLTFKVRPLEGGNNE